MQHESRTAQLHTPIIQTKSYHVLHFTTGKIFYKNYNRRIEWNIQMGNMALTLTRALFFSLPILVKQVELLVHMLMLCYNSVDWPFTLDFLNAANSTYWPFPHKLSALSSMLLGSGLFSCFPNSILMWGSRAFLRFSPIILKPALLWFWKYHSKAWVAALWVGKCRFSHP